VAVNRGSDTKTLFLLHTKDLSFLSPQLPSGLTCLKQTSLASFAECHEEPAARAGTSAAVETTPTEQK
jgi:hypothetical protein